MTWRVKHGETPLDDLSGLKLRVANPTREQIEAFEAINIAKAQERYFARRLTKRSAPFDLPWMKKLHRQMLGDVWHWAGRFRETNKSIGVDKYQIQLKLLQLIDDLHGWQSVEMPWLEQAVRLHHLAVQIHPFENGNGRWSRMLSNIWLRLHGQPVVLWPATIDKESPIRQDYLACLREADDMDYQPFLDLHDQYQER